MQAEENKDIEGSTASKQYIVATPKEKVAKREERITESKAIRSQSDKAVGDSSENSKVLSTNLVRHNERHERKSEASEKAKGFLSPSNILSAITSKKKEQAEIRDLSVTEVIDEVKPTPISETPVSQKSQDFASKTTSKTTSTTTAKTTSEANVQIRSNASKAIQITEGDDLITLSFSGRCWVEVRDLSGAILYFGLSHEGDRLNLRGQAPFKLLLGNPPAVDLVFNGDNVVLDSDAPKRELAVVLKNKAGEPAI